MRNITNSKDSIAELQRYLREIHHNDRRIPLVNPDGIYGDETRAAVSEFQRLYGLPITGATDLMTWDAVYREYINAYDMRADPHPISPFPRDDNYVIKDGEHSDIVTIVQFMLRLLGDIYDGIGGKEPEGVYNESTAADIREFQRITGLPITGDIDKATWNALSDAYNRAVKVDN